MNNSNANAEIARKMAKEAAAEAEAIVQRTPILPNVSNPQARAINGLAVCVEKLSRAVATLAAEVK